MGEVNFNIEDVVDFLGIEKKKGSRTSRSFDVRCPFCGDTKYHMNINTYSGVYKCVRCGTGGGTLDLFSRLYLNAPLSTLDGKEVYKTLLECLGRGGGAYRPYKKAEEVPLEKAAADDVLNTAYTALLSLFELSPLHKRNLIKRGLSEEGIERNGYKSFGQLAGFANSEVVGEFNRLHIANFFKEQEKTRFYRGNYTLASFAIGKLLTQKGIDLCGVPGFFLLGESWCCVIEEGMIIPTRNVFGQIVGLQIRKDKGDVRYKTFSSKGLPKGAEVGISRLHFPKENPKLTGSRVYLTEGPLKADIAKHLLKDDKAYFIACQGVSNTTALSKCFKWLARNGVKEVINALDMDKITNINVMMASKKIAGAAKECGICILNMYWDEEEAIRRLEELGYSKEQIEKPFQMLLMETKRHYDSGAAIDPHWGKYKGIDDYLAGRKG